MNWFVITSMDESIITSTSNPHIKEVLKLRKRSQRDESGKFIIEGYREVKRAIEKNISLEEVYYAPEWYLGHNEPELIKIAQKAGCNLIQLGRKAFAKISYRDRPDGLLAVAQKWNTDLDSLPLNLSKNPLVLVVEAIEKPGNLGTILRSADAAGVELVIVCDPVTDLFNPNVVRASTGVLFAVPVTIASNEETLEYLRAHKIKIFSTAPAAKKLYSKANFNQSTAIIMGSEQAGLSDFWLKNSDELVRIPMAGQADSLNVAMATLVTLFEAVRQRSG